MGCRQGIFYDPELLVVQMQHLHLQLLLSDLVGDLVGDLRHVLQLLAARRRWRGCVLW